MLIDENFDIQIPVKIWTRDLKCYACFRIIVLYIESYFIIYRYKITSVMIIIIFFFAISDMSKLA